jgi:DNA-binding CsgD family transcriptional regulator
MGWITLDQRSVLTNAILKNGVAENVELEGKVQGKPLLGLFNSTPITIHKKAMWLTVITNLTAMRRARAYNENILLKSLTAIVGTGVVMIRVNRKRDPDIFFINEEAKRALHKQPIKNLMDVLLREGSTYLMNDHEFYHAKMISTNRSSPLQIILMECMPDTLFIKEKLQQNDLTPRQRDVAYLASIGFSNREIAQKLFISEYTVKDHCKEIYQKIGISKRSQLALKILSSKDSNVESGNGATKDNL